MIEIINYINEKLKLDNEHIKKENIKKDYFPKNSSELKEIIIQLYKERGPNLNLNCIDTSEITDMSDIFYDLKKYRNLEIESIDVSSWDVSNVKNMEQMFRECDYFDCDLSSWDVSNVKEMYAMFLGCKNFIGEGLENWDISSCTNFKSMFMYCENLDIDLSQWKINKYADIQYMFWGCKNLKTNFDNLKHEGPFTQMFYGCDKIKKPKWYKKIKRD